MSLLTTARWLLIVPLLAGAAPCAFTQPAHDAPAPAETRGTAPTPLNYRSAMTGYRGFADAKPIAWQEANEVVHRRGGWRAYAKEAEAPATGDGPAAHDHAGHAMPMPEASTAPTAPSLPKARP